MTGLTAREAWNSYFLTNLLDSDVPHVLKEGGIMSVTGNYSNKYFKSIYNALPEVLRQAGFEAVSRGDAGSVF